MTPSMTAAPRDMPSSGAATTAASTVVISTPRTIRRITTLRMWPLSFRRSRLRPASYKMTATDNDTSGSNAGPSRRCGLTSVVSAPAAKPAGNSTMIPGMRRRLARTWDPTASARIRPTPIRIWFVVTPASYDTGVNG